MATDVIVVATDAAVLAVKQETQTIPIVMAGSTDPVGTGFVASLARPGGNVTGLSSMSPALSGKRRLPSMYGQAEYVDAGGLMSYGKNLVEGWKRAATYVDKILKGAKPADLPVEQPTKFELVVNMKTAKMLGLTMSPEIMVQATRVIQ